MSGTGEWSPDEPLETETFASWDEFLDEEDALEPDAVGNPEGERSLDSQLAVDSAELEEVGAGLDDPERLATLEGGMDDPDGVGPPDSVDATDEGWDLDRGDRLAAEQIDDEDDA